jgi:ATP-dependent 26S proteasome regulatory subunit
VRSQGRKIIFSTNLPNVGDLDDALIRPGRCFARVHTRELAQTEAERLIAKLASETAARPLKPGKKSHSLAEVYKALSAA